MYSDPPLRHNVTKRLLSSLLMLAAVAAAAAAAAAADDSDHGDHKVIAMTAAIIDRL